MKYWFFSSSDNGVTYIFKHSSSLIGKKSEIFMAEVYDV